MTPTVGDIHRIEWVDIDNPDAHPGQSPAPFPGRPGLAGGPFLKAWSKGALLLSRLEGICHHQGKFFVVDTAAGTGAEGVRGEGEGAVWEYDPQEQTLRTLFVAGTAGSATTSTTSP